MEETLKITAPPPNKPKEKPTMAYRYQRAYERCFKKLNEVNQARVIAARTGPDTTETRQFVKDVVTMAEGDVEL